MRLLGITQARVSSSRLPGKVLLEVGEMSFLEIHLRRLKKVSMLDGLVVAIAREPCAEKIEDICLKLDVPYVFGDLHDVLGRFVTASNAFPSQYVVRFTSDCPLIDPDLSDEVIEDFLSRVEQVDYSSNALEPTWPDGLDLEVFKREFLLRANKEAVLKSDREHVTPYIRKVSRIFSYKGQKDFSDYRLTLDNTNDQHVLTRLIDELGFEAQWIEYVKYLKLHPDLMRQSSGEVRNQGYLKSLKED